MSESVKLNDVFPVFQVCKPIFSHFFKLGCDTHKVARGLFLRTIHGKRSLSAHHMWKAVSFCVPYVESGLILHMIRGKWSLSAYHTWKGVAKQSKNVAKMSLFCQSSVARFANCLVAANTWSKQSSKISCYSPLKQYISEGIVTICPLKKHSEILVLFIPLLKNIWEHQIFRRIQGCYAKSLCISGYIRSHHNYNL